MRTENIFEAYFGVLLAALTVFILIALIGYLQKLFLSRKKTTPKEQKEAMNELLAKGVIDQKYYDNFFKNREHHEAYDRGDITLEELEKKTGQDFSHLKK